MVFSKKEKLSIIVLEKYDIGKIMASNRSENTYQKINTIFMRDANNIIMPYSGFVSPELEWLRNCKFDATEKIDGTNMRIEVTCNIIDGECHMVVEYKGSLTAHKFHHIFISSW